MSPQIFLIGFAEKVGTISLYREVAFVLPIQEAQENLHFLIQEDNYNQNEILLLVVVRQPVLVFELRPRLVDYKLHM